MLSLFYGTEAQACTQSLQLHGIIRIFTQFVRTLWVKIQDYGREKLSRRRGKYYDKRGASVQYGEVTQNTEIIRTVYGLHKSLVGGTVHVSAAPPSPASLRITL